MRKTISIAVCTLLAVFLVSPALMNAQTGLNWGEGFDTGLYQSGTKYAQAGMTFLNIDPTARVAALGGTRAATTGTEADIFANPAALAMMDGIGVTLARTNWLVDIGITGAAAAFSAGNYGVFGISLVNVDYGDIPRTIPYKGYDPALRNTGYIQTGTFSPSDMAIGLSYARQIISQFYVGGNVKWATENLGDVPVIDQLTGETITAHNSVNNVVLDFGTLYYPGFKDLRFGVNFRNFSNQSDYYNQRFELPLTFDFGIAMDLMKLFPGQSNNQLTLALDAVHPRDYSERVNMGLEYNFANTLFLRGGYKFNSSEAGLTAGLGIDYDLAGVGLRADYAYSAFGLFGAVHRFTIGFGL